MIAKWLVALVAVTFTTAIVAADTQIELRPELEEAKDSIQKICNLYVIEGNAARWESVYKTMKVKILNSSFTGVKVNDVGVQRIVYHTELELDLMGVKFTELWDCDASFYSGNYSIEAGIVKMDGICISFRCERF